MKKNISSLLTELVFLEQRHQAPDGEGGMIVEWRPLETVWAHIEVQKPGTFAQQWRGDRSHFVARYWVWIRQEHLLPDHYRLRWGTSLLMPLSAPTRIPGKEWQLIFAQEEERDHDQ